MKKTIILLIAIWLIEPVQILMAQNSSNKYVVVSITEHDSLVSIIDVQRNDSVFRIYSLLREQIDSTYNIFYVGDSIDAELVLFQPESSHLEKGMITSLLVLEEVYPGLYIGNHAPRGTVGIYLCSRLNGGYIKKDSFPLYPICERDFYDILITSKKETSHRKTRSRFCRKQEIHKQPW